MTPLNPEELAARLQTFRIEEVKEGAETVVEGRKLKVVKDVHWDDIHCILKLADRTFITGSKDGSLKKWDFNGKAVKDVYNPGKIEYESWITALAPLGQKQWLSGTRDGYIHLWDLNGTELKQICSPPKETRGVKCKQRNWTRVNCLSDLSAFGNRLRFLAGWPAQFTLHSSPEFRSSGYCQTSKNDWVYSIIPLKETRFLTVTGACLDIWEHSQGDFKKWKREKLIQENPAAEGPRQRSFISAVTPLGKDIFGLSVFDGSVVVYDLHAKKSVMRGLEHKGRVWMIEPITPSCFASCADDGLIKLWDLRSSEKSIFSIEDNQKAAARVSVLLSLEEFKLISGSCPNDVYNSRDKAQLSFWDFRKV